MFRDIEAVFKANRSFLNAGQSAAPRATANVPCHYRLKEISPNRSSPEALGDLLMHWVDCLELLLPLLPSFSDLVAALVPRMRADTRCGKSCLWT